MFSGLFMSYPKDREHEGVLGNGRISKHMPDTSTKKPMGCTCFVAISRKPSINPKELEKSFSCPVSS